MVEILFWFVVGMFWGLVLGEVLEGRNEHND